MKTGLEFLRDIKKKGTIHPVYYLYGEEGYLIDKTIKVLEDKTLTPSLKELNYQVFYAPQAVPSEIIDSANTLPAFSQRRVVLAKDTHLFSQEQLNCFLPYLRSPSPTTLLVFVGEKADLRKAFFTEIDKKGGMVKFPLLKKGQIPYWLKKEASRWGKKITTETMDYLMDIVGNSLIALSQEIEKLSLYVGEKEVIELNDIKEIGTDTKISSIFDFTDAVGSKDVLKALTALRKLLRIGEPPPKILSMVERHFRLLWRTKIMVEKRIDINSIGKKLGITPYITKLYLKQEKAISKKELKDVFCELHASDLAIKTGRMPFNLILEGLSIRLCGCKYACQHTYQH